VDFLGVLKKGTIEPLIVDMRDRLETITDMSTVTNLRFDVTDMAGNAEVTNGIPSTDGMRVVCLIDTTGAGWVAPDQTGEEYRLYIRFTDGSAAPLLLVGKFRVEND
jgi:hypothetical protein